MLRLGIISYLNTLPVYYAIEKGLVKLPEDIEVVKGVPSELNRMLSDGSIDVAVVSAFEYAQNHKNYLILPKLCIGAEKEVKSVLFFSTVPMEELNGKEVFLTKASLTSKNLLIHLFKEMGIKPIYREFSMEEGIPNNGYMGILLIGDDALKVKKRGCLPFVYDLAGLWWQKTKKPMVFALWCTRKEAYMKQPDEVKRCWEALLESKKISRKLYPKIAEEKSRELGLTEKECLEYLKTLHFDLEKEYIEGLKAYFHQMHTSGLLNEVPELTFAY